MSINAAGHSGRDPQYSSGDTANSVSRSRTDISPIEHAVTPDHRLLMAHDPYHPHCEKVRMLRTELLLRREAIDSADIVALLSPGAGEGRSLLAAELAIAFAQTGRPTLLVDADLRHPQQHLLFHADNRCGLSQVIEHGMKPRLHSVTGLPRMSLLTAGVSSNPLELLSSKCFAALIEEWRSTFQFVVIDTAPSLLFSDGLAVASLAGRVLTLSRAQHTRYKDMQEMLRRLAATRAQLIGAVISHF